VPQRDPNFAEPKISLHNLRAKEAASCSTPPPHRQELAAELAGDTIERAAQSLVLALDWNEDRGTPLGQTQKIVLAEAVLKISDGLESQFLERIERHDERALWVAT
jgi:hypothetical protein